MVVFSTPVNTDLSNPFFFWLWWKETQEASPMDCHQDKMCLSPLHKSGKTKSAYSLGLSKDCCVSTHKIISHSGITCWICFFPPTTADGVS